MDKLRLVRGRMPRAAGGSGEFSALHERLRVASAELEGLLLCTPRTAAACGVEKENKLNGWERYAAFRGLDSWLAHKKEREERLRLLSRLLTYPMTLSSCVARGDVGARAPEAAELHLAVLGARAESSLPRLFWSEMLTMLPRVDRVHMYFVGPDVSEEKREDVVRDPVDGKVRFAFHTERALFHSSDALGDMQRAASAGDHVHASAFAFNSGLSHEAVRHLWAPTLDALDDARLPAVFTSFNEADYALDVRFAENDAAWSNRPISSKRPLNPFRSLWMEEFSTARAKASRGEDATEIVGCNHCYFSVSSRT